MSTLSNAPASYPINSPEAAALLTEHGLELDVLYARLTDVWLRTADATYISEVQAALRAQGVKLTFILLSVDPDGIEYLSHPTAVANFLNPDYAGPLISEHLAWAAFTASQTLH